MESPWWSLIRLIAGVVAGYIVYRIIRWWLVRRAALLERRQHENRCSCGYPLKDLGAARCPECGRVVGFDATAEELGLTTEELEQAQATRRARENNR